MSGFPKLDELGIKYSEHKGKIERLELPLTKADWWELCTREGDEYVGGCCGNMSHVQDHLNEVFREGGWVRGSTFREIMLALEEHGNFEDIMKTFAELGTEDPAELLKRSKEHWLHLGPLNRLFLTWELVKSDLNKERVAVANVPNRPEIEDAVHLLARATYSLSWDFLITDSLQTTAQKALMYRNVVRRLGPALGVLYRNLKGLEPETIDPAFAICKRGTHDIMENSRGLMVYDTREEAETWVKEYIQGGEPEHAILECTVSMDAGVTIKGASTT